MNDGWYGALKEAIQQQQNQLVWVSEGKVRHFLLSHLLTCFLHYVTDRRCFGFLCFLMGLVFIICVEGLRELFLVATYSEILSTIDLPLQWCFLKSPLNDN